MGSFTDWDIECPKCFSEGINTTNSKINISMFTSAIAFNQPLDNWITTDAKHMNAMFNNAQSFNQPLTNFVTNNVINMEAMFKDAKDFDDALSLKKIEDKIFPDTNIMIPLASQIDARNQLEYNMMTFLNNALVDAINKREE